MPRGRPKGSKNKVKKSELFTLTDITNIEEQSNIEEKPSSKIKEKPIKIVCNCDLCSEPIYDSPYKIQLQNLSGKASWHRNSKVDKLSICNKCAEELSNTIDSFILSKNPSLKKFDIS